MATMKRTMPTLKTLEYEYKYKWTAHRSFVRANRFALATAFR